MRLKDARSPFTTCRDAALVVDLYDSDPILNVCEVFGILLRLVLDVAVGGIIFGVEIPVTCATRSISLGEW